MQRFQMVPGRGQQEKAGIAPPRDVLLLNREIVDETAEEWTDEKVRGLARKNWRRRYPRSGRCQTATASNTQRVAQDTAG